MCDRMSGPLLAIAFALAPVVFAQTRSVPTFITPAFADLTIRKHHSFGTPSWSMTEVLYLKGARARREFLEERAGNRPHRHAVITQCDQRRRIELNPDARLYAVSVLEDWSERSKPRPSEPEARGADVTTTLDAVDTGERRRVGHYMARRVKTTITVEPSPGANTPPSTRETDGWYIDLRGLDCSDVETDAYYLAFAEVVKPGGLRDRQNYRTKGTAMRGYAIAETNRVTQSGTTEVDSVKLIELSERPLDSSMFDISPDYRPALPLLRGGYDMTKRDTVANRLQAYWDEFVQVTRTIFR